MTSRKIEYLSNLEFGNDTFTYNGVEHSLKSIKAITFTAVHTRHSINFIPTGSSYDADLILHLPDGYVLRIGPDRAYFASAQKLRMEAVWKAKEWFSDITFSQRLRSYDDQLKTKQFFSCGQYQFRKDGDVFRGGLLLCNANDSDIAISLGPFHVFFVRTKKTLLQQVASVIVSWDWAVDVSKDRDCFLYMFRTVTGKYWQNEDYRKYQGG